MICSSKAIGDPKRTTIIEGYKKMPIEIKK